MRRERAAALDRLIDAARATRGASTRRSPARSSGSSSTRCTSRRTGSLIELYAAAGRRGDAFAQYRECVRVLDRELGVQPLSETTELYNAISGGHRSSSRRSPSRVPQTGRAAAGRARAPSSRRIADTFGALADDGALVVIEGESGVGKTRLARRGDRARSRARRARAHGARRTPASAGSPTASSRSCCAPRSAPSPTPFRSRSRARRWRACSPSSAPRRRRSLDEPGARQRFLESISRLIADAFDDRRRRACSSTICSGATPRRSMRSPTSRRRLAQRPHAAARRASHRRARSRAPMRAARRRSASASGSAGCAATTSSASRCSRGSTSRPASEVFRESEGLPLFVAELLSAGGGGPSGGVRAALEARLDAVGEAAAQVLGAAALIGRDVRRRHAARRQRPLRGGGRRRARGADDPRPDRRARRRLRLRSRAPARDRRGARSASRDGACCTAASPRHSATRTPIPRSSPVTSSAPATTAQAALAYAAAGDRARSLSAGTEAIAHYEAALALGHPDPAALHEAIGDVDTLRGAYGARARRLRRRRGAERRPAPAGIEHKLGSVHERRGEWQLAESHYVEALALGADPAVVQADRSRVAWRRGDADGARDARLRGARARRRRPARVAAAAQANNILGLLGCGRAYLERSLELSTRAGRSGDPDRGAEQPRARPRRRGRARPRRGAAARGARAVHSPRATATTRLRCATTSPTSCTRQGAAMGRWRSSSAPSTAFAAIGSEGGELYPGVWSLVEW